MASAPVHRRVAKLTKTIDHLIVLQTECLRHLILTLVYSMGARSKSRRTGKKQCVALGGKKTERTGLLVQIDTDLMPGRLSGFMITEKLFFSGILPLPGHTVTRTTDGE